MTLSDAHRTGYRADVPKKSGPIIFSSDSGKSYRAVFHGDSKGGRVYVKVEELEDFSKFYVQIAQNMGPFEESDTFSITPRITQKLSDKYVALIPCYNSEPYIEAVIEESVKYTKYLLLVDDGSTDSTPAIIKNMQQKYPEQVHILTLEKNQGKGHALLAGFRYALDHFDFESIVCLDSDSQHKPSDIPRLAEAISDGEDFVIGTRVFNLMPFRSRFANTAITILLRRVYEHPPHDTQSGYRALSRSFTEEILSHVKGGQYEMEFDCLLYALSNKKRIRSLPISTIYVDNNASSKFSPIKDSIKILKVLLQYGKNKQRN